MLAQGTLKLSLLARLLPTSGSFCGIADEFQMFGVQRIRHILPDAGPYTSITMNLTIHQQTGYYTLGTYKMVRQYEYPIRDQTIPCRLRPSSMGFQKPLRQSGSRWNGYKRRLRNITMFLRMIVCRQSPRQGGTRRSLPSNVNSSGSIFPRQTWIWPLIQ